MSISFFVKEKWRISLLYIQWWVILKEVHIEMTHILEESNREIGTQLTTWTGWKGNLKINNESKNECDRNTLQCVELKL